jgi:hypothetical protein
MTNKQFPTGRTIFHLEFKNETDPEKKNKYYSNLSALVADNKELGRSLSFFQKRDWKISYECEAYKIIKSKLKTSNNTVCQ